ncbi:hypothetical protein [Sphingomonas gilva]|nr:hypothetical protein [Sphingomonas gilva]
MNAGANWWIRYRTPIKAALFPLSLGWAAANRYGWLGEPAIGSAPHLNPRALACWREAMAHAKVYLEYGAGGSTVEAVQSAAHVVSVETDGRYLAAVARRVAGIAGRGAFHPVHVDIGWTSKWGQPVVTRRSSARLARWRRYPSAPWAVLEKEGLVPDFIFVDGRFRLASVLESLLRLPDGSDCLIMFDDFEGRAATYGRVLEFAEDVQRLDGTIAFRRRRDFDRAQCRRYLDSAQGDPF